MSANVLLLSSDPLLEYAVQHVLPGDTYLVHRGDLRERVAELLTQLQPRALLVDLPDPGPEDVEHVRWLHGSAGAPVLVLTRDPKALDSKFEPAVRILPRAFQPTELQAAFRDVLVEPAAAPARKSRLGKVIAAAIWIVVVAAAALLVLPMLGVPGVPNVLKMFVARPQANEEPPVHPFILLPGKDTFRLEPDTYEKLKIPPPFKVRKDPARRQLVLSGSLAFDPNRLGRIQPRFAGELMEIGKSEEVGFTPGKGSTRNAPLSYGSLVRKGQLMAVLWSKDLGEKKSELVDALVKLHLDEKNLTNLKALAEGGAGSEAAYRQAQNAVSTDLNAIARARRTLAIWKVGKDEIDEIEKEADRIIASKSRQDLDKMKDKSEKWARVEVRAPFEGVVVEKNLTLGSMVDPSQDLFKIADLSRLAVFANAYEEDQRLLQKIQQRVAPAPIPWRVHLTSDPDRTPLSSPGIERIGYIVDPTQRTNLAIGRVRNKSGELRVGQSVTAEVDVPPPPDVVSVPASALVEDGDSSVLFVVVPGKEHTYAMRRVVVGERFNGHAYIRSFLDDKQKALGLQELHPGEQVVIGGAVELKAGLEEVQARARRK
jgi:cobalt-zinc-cadmium efflux system membrane fusion protein